MTERRAARVRVPLRGTDEPASARLANLERALQSARAEIEALRVARDAALRVAAWSGGRPTAHAPERDRDG